MLPFQVLTSLSLGIVYSLRVRSLSYLNDRPSAPDVHIFGGLFLAPPNLPRTCSSSCPPLLFSLPLESLSI